MTLVLTMIFVAQVMKAETKKWDYIKLKTLFTAKEAMNKMKR